MKESQLFRSPLPEPARIALLETGLQAGPGMCAGTVDDLSWLRGWAPNAIALPLSLALSLAEQKKRGLFELPSLNTAVIVLTSVGHSPLGDHHRDTLWRAFGVPVFEQLRGPDGAVIARECEVHDGLHFLSGEVHGLAGDVVTDHCACGLETPRLRHPVRVHSQSAVA